MARKKRKELSDSTRAEVADSVRDKRRAKRVAKWEARQADPEYQKWKAKQDAEKKKAEETKKPEPKKVDTKPVTIGLPKRPPVGDKKGNWEKNYRARVEKKKLLERAKQGWGETGRIGIPTRPDRPERPGTTAPGRPDRRVPDTRPGVRPPERIDKRPATTGPRPPVKRPEGPPSRVGLRPPQRPTKKKGTTWTSY